MGRKLKIGFAMGGGVSLGTFSGAALSEAIKQAVLYGGYKDEAGKFQPYENIEIDVFSGASAGMMSLAIMLRGLAHQSNVEKVAAEKHLEKEFEKQGDFLKKFKENSPEKYDQLLAAQVVQDIQNSIWIEQINIETLLGYFDEALDLTYEPGILARKALTQIAKKNFRFEPPGTTLFTRRQLLAERVLICSALANLTPIKHDARPDPNDPGYEALGDPFTSYVHRELRIFDLNFRQLSPGEIDIDPPSYPSRWIRYHMGPENKGYMGDLRDIKSWSKIVSTGIACGAFPFAFEPVVLNRHDFEFGWHIEKETGKVKRGDWPEEFKDKKEYPFSYVDGGTFNNEPIREAYRLAAFQDAGDVDFDRVIIFVDPNIASEAVNYRVPIHQEYHLRDPQFIHSGIAGYNAMRSTTADRLVAHIGTMFSMIINEAKVNEPDKIHRAVEMFTESRKYHNLLLQLMDKAVVDDQYILDVSSFANDVLKSQCVNELLPAGAVTLKEEIMRINRLEKLGLDKDDIQHLADGKLELISTDGKKVALKVLLMLLVDLMMGLGGTVKNSKTIGIAPVIWKDGKYQTTFLPGGHIAAFAGFTSKIPNLYEAKLGCYCAQSFMKRTGCISEQVAVAIPCPPWTDDDQRQFKEEFNSKLGIIGARVFNLLTSTRLLNIGEIVDKAILKRISNKINEALTVVEFIDKKITTYLFKIPTVSEHYQIACSEKNGDIKTIMVGNTNYLMVELGNVSIDKKPGQWDKKNVHIIENNCIVIEYNKSNVDIFDKKICSVVLPSEAQVEKAKLMSNPVFTFDKMISEGESKGKTYGNEFWKLNDDVTPLEDILLP